MKEFFRMKRDTRSTNPERGEIPHLLREEFFVVFVLVSISLFLFSQNNFKLIKGLNLTASVYPAVLVDLTNKDRARFNVKELAWSPTLEQASKLKAEDMIKNGYFAHISPSGVTPWYWLSKVNYNFKYAGENLAIDFYDSENVEQAWLHSEKHKENILNPNFTEIGIAAVDGVINGKKTTVIVEFFGSKAKKKVENKNVVTKNILKAESGIVTPAVAGEYTENITTINETSNSIIVENTSVEPMDISSTQDNKSSWLKRFIFIPSETIKYIYIVLIGLVLISMTHIMSKKYRDGHAKHLILGVVLVTFLFAMLNVLLF